jgi:hypothetical protein
LDQPDLRVTREIRDLREIPDLSGRLEQWAPPAPLARPEQPSLELKARRERWGPREPRASPDPVSPELKEPRGFPDQPARQGPLDHPSQERAEILEVRESLEPSARRGLSVQPARSDRPVPRAPQQVLSVQPVQSAEQGL